MVFLGQIIESIIIIDCQDLVFNLPYVYKCAVVHPVAISQCDEPLLFLSTEKNAELCCFLRCLVNSHTLLSMTTNTLSYSYAFLLLLVVGGAHGGGLNTAASQKKINEHHITQSHKKPQHRK